MDRVGSIGSLIDQVWRGMFGAETIPAALFFLLLFLLPESPRWLAKECKIDQASQILAKIGGRETAQSQIAEINESLSHEKGTLAELFQPGLRIALLVGVGPRLFRTAYRREYRRLLRARDTQGRRLRQRRGVSRPSRLRTDQSHFHDSGNLCDRLLGPT